ncbi:MBG domain-containing protein, partial [Flavobacterium daejeonense]|uniref:MBG domain-containing protein n=1 Tax=Flavobacterium daejeonense TaxID=350893 RepID=UPI00138E24FE
MKTILPFSRFLFFVFLITNLLFANISFGQIVILDQVDLDYAPGETVYISGSGWQPGETIMLEVDNLTNPDVDCGPVTPQPHESWTTVADENGNFTASWYVNDCELGADLMLGALGSSSGFTYEVFFTDANVTFTTSGLPNNTSVTVNYRVYPTGSPSGSFTSINFVTPNASSPAIAVNNSQTIEYTFNDVSVSGVTYKASRGSVVGANNGNGGQQITGIYTACTPPAAPTVNSPLTYCQGSSSNPLTATGDNLLWYTSASGGTGSTTAPTPSTTSLGTTSYYASQTIGCESPRAKIDVVINGVNPGVIGKGVTQPGPGCGILNPGITSEVMAASGPGTISYIWQVSTDNGGNWTTVTSATSSQYNPDSFATTTSFKRIATSTLNGISCSAESNVLTYEVNPIPVVASILPGGTTNVCVGSSFQLSNATLGGVWSSADPAIATVSTNGLVTGIASGDVSVTYTVTDVNTGCSKAANKTIHVLALPTAPTAVNYSGVYDGVSHTGTATSNLGEEIDWYTTATGTTPTVAPVGTNVGTYSAYAEARNTTSGCKSATRTLVTVVITPKAATVTANAKSKTYGDFNPTLDASVTGTVNGDILDYSLATTAIQFSSVGDYPITVTLGSNPNYSVTPINGLLTIGKRAITITADAKSKTYGDSDPVLTYQITSGSLAFSDVFSGSLSRDAGESVGDYAITQGSVALNSNYTLTYVGAD